MNIIENVSRRRFVQGALAAGVFVLGTARCLRTFLDRRR